MGTFSIHTLTSSNQLYLHKHFPNQTNLTNHHHTSTCLLPTPTSPTRASSARPSTLSPTPPTTSPRPSRATLLRHPRRRTSSRPRATFPATTLLPTACLVLPVP